MSEPPYCGTLRRDKTQFGSDRPTGTSSSFKKRTAESTTDARWSSDSGKMTDVGDGVSADFEALIHPIDHSFVGLEGHQAQLLDSPLSSSKKRRTESTISSPGFSSQPHQSLHHWNYEWVDSTTLRTTYPDHRPRCDIDDCENMVKWERAFKRRTVSLHGKEYTFFLCMYHFKEADLSLKLARVTMGKEQSSHRKPIEPNTSAIQTVRVIDDDALRYFVKLKYGNNTTKVQEIKWSNPVSIYAKEPLLDVDEWFVTRSEHNKDMESVYKRLSTVEAKVGLGHGQDYAYEVVLGEGMTQQNMPYGTVVGVSKDWTISLDTSNCDRIGVIPAKPWHTAKLVGGSYSNDGVTTSRVAIVGKVAVNIGQSNNQAEVVTAITRGDWVFASGNNDGYGVLRALNSDGVSHNEDIRALIGRPHRVLSPTDPLVTGVSCEEVKGKVREKVVVKEKDSDGDVFVEVWVCDNDVLQILERCLPRSRRDGEVGLSTSTVITTESEVYVKEHFTDLISAALERKGGDFLKQLKEVLEQSDKKKSTPISCGDHLKRTNWNVCPQTERLKAIGGSLGSRGRCVLWGSKGVGKSDIAQQYKHACEVRAGGCKGGSDGGGGVDVLEYDLMWWLDGTSVEATVRDLLEMAKELNDDELSRAIDQAGGDDVAKLKAIWRSLFKSGRRCLFVVDDLVCLGEGDRAVGEVVEEWEKALLPDVKSNAHFVFTTNSEDVARSICQKEDRIEMDGLSSDEDAIRMLKSVCVGGGDDKLGEEEDKLEYWSTIAVTYLNRHPQAILVAGSVMRSTHGKQYTKVLEWYISQLADEGRVMPEQKRKRRRRPTSVDTLKKSIVRTYTLALNRIRFDDASAETDVTENSGGNESTDEHYVRLARELLCRLCFVDGTTISPTVVKALCVGCPSWATSDTDGLVADTVATLAEVGLVTVWKDGRSSSDGGGDGVRMHSLSRDMILNIFGDTGVRLDNAVCGVFRSLKRLMDQTCGAHHRWCCEERTLVHIISCLQKLVSFDKRYLQLVTGGNKREWMGALSSVAKSSEKLSKRRFHFGQRIRLHQLCLSFFQRTANIERTDAEILYHLECIGTGFYHQGSYIEALDYYNRALMMYQKIYGNEDQPTMTRTLNNVGRVHAEKGSYVKALDYYNRALTMYRKIYGNEGHSWMAQTLNNIGRVHAEKGSYVKALEYYDEALTMYQKIYGNEGHSWMAQTLNNIGRVHAEKGSYVKALEYYDEALTMYQKIYGNEDHMLIARTLNNIGRVHAEKGSYVKALEICGRALTMYRNIYDSGDHLDMVSTLNNIGRVHGEKASYVEALEYYNEALGMCETLFSDEDHPLMARIMNNIGRVHAEKGSSVQALEYYNRALTMYQKIYGNEDHMLIARTLNNIGRVHAEKGSYVKALEYYNRALMMYQKIYGNEGHSWMAQTLNNIGRVHAEKGSYVKALEYYDEALTMYQKIYGNEGHSWMAQTLNNIGRVHAEKGSYVKALEYYDEALTMYQKIYGNEGHPLSNGVDGQTLLSAMSHLLCLWRALRLLGSSLPLHFAGLQIFKVFDKLVSLTSVLSIFAAFCLFLPLFTLFVPMRA